MTRPRSFLPALILFAATPVSATTLHVPSEYATIQAATTTAVAGDSIEIACGTYYESGLVLPAGVVVRSETGFPDCVTISGELGNPLGRGILTCSGDSSTLIKGLTLRQGFDEDHGGGLRISGSPIIDHCSIVGCGSLSFGGGAWVTAGSNPLFRDCNFLNNSGESVGGIAIYGQGTFERCQFRGNRARNGSGGAVEGSGTFTDCVFQNNEAYIDGGAIYSGAVTLVRCVFVGNTCGTTGYAGYGGAVDASVTAIDCTFYGNSVFTTGSDRPHGSTIAGAVMLRNCIIVGSPCGDECGTVVEGGYFGPEPIIECTNIWYPTEDAWAGSIGSQLGQNGNISVDPRFCDAVGGDFRLSSLSPCLDAPCGTMGAFGLGCYDARPRIISIKDVGNDQGRQVRLTWYRANDDFSGSPFDGYAVYRRQDLYAAPPTAIQSSGRGAVAIPGWDYVTTIPNRWDNVYQAIVPTLCDSTITSGQCWSAFFISALTPTAFYDSPVDSGYSRDNLAPPTPTSFAVSYNTGSGNHLVWDAVAASDWAGFRVYRGTTPSFTTSPVSLVYSTSQTSWNDSAFDGWDVYYKVTSFDLAGNESTPTGSATVTAVGNVPKPLTLELGPNVPNPFNPSTTIPFTIPSAGRVTITIYDVSGARVRTLVNRSISRGGIQRCGTGRTTPERRWGRGCTWRDWRTRRHRIQENRGHQVARRPVLVKKVRTPTCGSECKDAGARPKSPTTPTSPSP